MDVRDLEIAALKQGQFAKMAANVGVALYRVQAAIVHGSVHCTMPHDMYAKLSAAQAALEDVEAEIARRRERYENV
jgi:hypothetical protein